ncbi:hypothetical protein P7C71_g3161, partial [Lecanoromycetidae sp. Uapishka_2]
MSLHRVSSMSSYEHVRGSSPARSEHKKVSFNPVESWAPPTKDMAIGAFEIPKGKRILQIVLAIIYCLLAAGIVFGYAAIKPVLVKEGVYRQLCDQEEKIDYDKTCDEQEIRLNLMFTIAAASTNAVAMPVGKILDDHGPRVCGVIGSILIAIGSLFMAFARQVPFDAYIPGYTLLALGGPFVFIPSFPLSNAFPQHSGLILALLTGAFDSSSALFLIYRLIYQATNGSFSLQKFFLIYLIVPVYILVVQLFIMPAKVYMSVGEMVTHAEGSVNDLDTAEHDTEDTTRRPRAEEERRQHRESTVSEVTSLLGKSGTKQQKAEEKKKNISGVWGALHGRSAFQQVFTYWYLLITLFTVVQMTRINYFVATIRTQYEYMLRSEYLAERVNHVFDIALPIGGILSVPFIGLVLDNTSTTFVLGLLVGIASTIGVLGVIPFTWAAYLNIALFVLYRPLYYTAVSDYAAKVFGFHTFGKVYGSIILIAGILNLSQSGLDAITQKRLGRDPLPVNLFLLFLVMIIGSILVGYVYYQSRHMKRDHLEEEAEETPDTVMPVATEGIA